MSQFVTVRQCRTATLLSLTILSRRDDIKEEGLWSEGTCSEEAGQRQLVARPGWE
jgi:hypothetical protein